MLYELVVTGNYFGQETINRWNYLSTSTPSSVSLSFALISAFGGIQNDITHAFDAGSMMASMAAIQNTAFNYVSILAKAIYDPTDFYTTPFFVGTAGLRTNGRNAAPFVAYGLRSNQVRLDIKSGQKRLAGVAGDDVSTGGVLGSEALGFLQTIADIMSGPLVYSDEGASLTFTPCVVKKQKYTAPSGKPAYKYFPTLAEQVPSHVAQNPIWSVKPQERSQTSRQYGKGV